LKTAWRWGLGGVIAAALVGGVVWLAATDAPAYQFLTRLYVDKRFLKQTLREWGVLAPLVFIGLQALQVIVAPIPGQLTGILGGYLFGDGEGCSTPRSGCRSARWRRSPSPDGWARATFNGS
jgi:uncharacterized membrane protein YdjX (TVP38/TMEM64 family)